MRIVGRYPDKSIVESAAGVRTYPYLPFNSAGQFTTSVGGGYVCRVSGTIIRNRCPSLLTTYRLRPT
jgi:hypothetical protein